MKRKQSAAALAAAVILLLTIFGIFLLRREVERRRVLHPADHGPRPPEGGIPPVEQWTDVFAASSAGELVDLLERIEKEHPDLYSRWSLAYLHARALASEGEEGAAAEKLAPFLKPGHPWRDRALYHRAAAASGAEASRYRTQLLTDYEDSAYRETAIDEEIESLSTLDETGPLLAFAARIAPSAPTSRRRDVSARIVETLAADGEDDEARRRGVALLKGLATDDAAGRVARAFAEHDLIEGLNAAELSLLAAAFQHHREYDRAIELTRQLLRSGYDDERQFALGRACFGKENFDAAEAAYRDGAAKAKTAEWKVTFFFHASRAAQLRGDDRNAEALMTQAIAVKGNFDATRAALTQRLRTRLHQKRDREAAADLALLRRIAPDKRSYLDGALAYGVAMVARGQRDSAIRAFDSIPRSLINDYDEAELAYWRGRALESSNPAAALDAYLTALRQEGRTLFSTFARQRLATPAMATEVAAAIRSRDAEVAKLLREDKREKRYDLARRLQTDRLLLTSGDRAPQLKTLAAIYRQIPGYREILELKPAALPRFPEVDPSDHPSLLMAMGLHDDAVETIRERWDLRPERDALTRSRAMYLAGSSRESIYAIEILMRSVPDDFAFALLPPPVQQLLYPRYFHGFIVEDAKRHDADPVLLLSLMREESRFDPRARSQAAARGLLQFIITTARDIGRAVGLVELTPDDLYDPRVIIRLGAGYVGELSETLGGNHHRVAAAYNAGPFQSRLWARLQSAPGDDYFLTAVNFDETKHYVRKVMTSYARYREVYGAGGD